MKKLLLLSMAASISIATVAQNRMMSPKSSPSHGKLIEKDGVVSEQKAVATPRNYVQRNPTVQAAAVTDIPLGKSTNAFTTLNIRSAIDCRDDLNTITFIRRADLASQPGTTSGELFFDISKDGGATWTINQGPLYSEPANVFRGRYPNAVIYNPSGNTNPDNAYLSYYAPITDGAGWLYDCHGTGNLGTPFASTQTVNPHPYPDGTDLTVPDGMVITQQGQTYVYDPHLTDELTTGYDGIVQLRHGVWNSSTFDMDYNTIFVSIPTSVDAAGGADFAGQSGAAFANDGLTGYAWINCHNDYAMAPDSAYFIGLAKTTDGGLTWSNPMYIHFNGTGPGTVDAMLGSSGTNGLYTTWTESDGVVDMNGNLHMILIIGPSTNPLGVSYNIDITPGGYGLFDLYTTDQGNTWKVELLDKPQRFDATFVTGGPATEFSRGQASKTWAGDKVFFGWMDTDTATFGGTENFNPDVHARAFDVVTGLWTPAVNLTAGSAADGACTFLNMAPYVLENGTTFTIPCTYTKVLTDIAQSVEHHYLGGLDITSADFTVAANPSNDLTTFVVSGVNELDENIAEASNIFPNPASTEAYMILNLKKASEVSVDVKNVLGQTVLTNKIGNLNAGQNTLTFNANELSKGVYMVTINVDNSSVTRKLVIQK